MKTTRSSYSPVVASHRSVRVKIGTFERPLSSGNLSQNSTVPRTPHSSEALSEVLARQFPNLSRDAINRVTSGKSLFASRHKLRPELSDRDYARLCHHAGDGALCQDHQTSAHPVHFNRGRERAFGTRDRTGPAGFAAAPAVRIVSD